MEVILPGNKVCAGEVVITPDLIKLIKPQLMIMQGWRERWEGDGGPFESFLLMRLESRHTEQMHNLLN